MANIKKEKQTAHTFAKTQSGDLQTKKWHGFANGTAIACILCHVGPNPKTPKPQPPAHRSERLAGGQRATDLGQIGKHDVAERALREISDADRGRLALHQHLRARSGGRPSRGSLKTGFAHTDATRPEGQRSDFNRCERNPIAIKNIRQENGALCKCIAAREKKIRLLPVQGRATGSAKYERERTHS